MVLQLPFHLVRPSPPSSGITAISSMSQLQHGDAVDVLKLGLWCPAAVAYADAADNVVMLQGV